MVFRSLSALLLLIAFGCINSQRPLPRRDENFPPPSQITIMKPLSEQCIKETGVSPAAIKRFSDEDIFEDDRALKCFMACMFRLADLNDDKGELHLLKMLDFMTPGLGDIALHMGVNCVKAKGKDVCERAFWYHKCWKLSDPVHYFLV